MFVKGKAFILSKELNNICFIIGKTLMELSFFHLII